MDRTPRSSRPPTQRQLEVLAFIASFQRAQGYAPSIRDVSTHFGFASTRAAVCHIDALVDKGFLSRVPRVARSLRVRKVVVTPVSMEVCVG